MTKIDIINKKEFIIEKDGKIYKYTFYADLNLKDYIKNIKSALKVLDINILEIDLDEPIERIRELYKEELILILLGGNKNEYKEYNY